jgi:phosphatidylglycerol:prolipoprotein diacylglycerol transferase
VHPILFKFTLPWGLGEHTVGTFGIMVMLGVIAGSLWLSRALKRIGVTDKDAPSDLVTWAVVVGLLGARWTYLAIHPEALQGPIDLIALWKGGIVSYGGFFGGALGAWIWCKRRHVSPRLVGDAMMPALFLGQAFGRIGCFLVGDDYGKPWNGPWAVTFPRVEGSLMPDELIGVPLHPSQLYLCLMNILIFTSMAWLFRRRRWDGQVLITTMFLYATGRFLIEFTRGDDAARGIYGVFSTAQWWSVATAVFATVLYVRIGAHAAPATPLREPAKA